MLTFHFDLEKVHSIRCLGVNIDENLTWEDHMLSIRQKVAGNAGIMKRIKPVIKLENLIGIYRLTIEPCFTYCCIVWDTIGDTQT